MQGSPIIPILRTVTMRCLPAFFFFVAAAYCAAQAAPAVRQTVPVLLVSDIHFEPFWDPAKTAQLAAAPASQWKTILAAQESPDRAARFDALQN
ncbi:MAG: hypothetical protein WBX18_14380, partial [Terracidiphilus sp.]